MVGSLDSPKKKACVTDGNKQNEVATHQRLLDAFIVAHLLCQI